jgi:hypothetical protein
MRLSEILCEWINADDIQTISVMTNMQQARAATLDLMFNNARSPERRADLRQQVTAAGTVPQLVKLLWSMKLSNEGLPTGIKTKQGRKGRAYDI